MTKISKIITKTPDTLPAHAKSNLHELIVKLPHETNDRIRICHSLKLKENNQSIGYGGKVTGITNFNLDKDTFVSVNSMSGDIVDANKPMFKSWKKVFKQIDDLLTQVNQGLNNPQKVEKQTLEISSFAKKN